MSWEDCGYRPGTVHGPEKCPLRCGDCDGLHHFYVDDESDSRARRLHSDRFVCAHCPATADLVDEDNPAQAAPQPPPSENDVVAAYLLDRADQYPTDSPLWQPLAKAAEAIASGEHATAMAHGELEASLFERVARMKRSE